MFHMYYQEIHQENGSDYFTGHVLDNITGEQVAVLKQEYDEISYTRQMYCLGKYYNEALIGIEANYTTFPLEELQRLRYTKQYVRERKDSYTNNITKAYGFKTTSITRPNILGNLQKILKEEIHLIIDADTLQEGLTFIKNEKGRPEAQVGYHDDLIMALAIAYDIRTQQKTTLSRVEGEGIANFKEPFFSIEKPNIYDEFGDSIEIV